MPGGLGVRAVGVWAGGDVRTTSLSPEPSGHHPGEGLEGKADLSVAHAACLGVRSHAL